MKRPHLHIVPESDLAAKHEQTQGFVFVPLTKHAHRQIHTAVIQNKLAESVDAQHYVRAVAPCCLFETRAVNMFISSGDCFILLKKNHFPQINAVLIH